LLNEISEQKIKELENSLLAQISVDFKIENDYSIAVNELCKSISKLNWVELWTSNLEKKPNAIIQSLCSRYIKILYSPEFVQIKSLRIINNILAEYNFWSMISRDAAKK
jgi:hypothetical protein